MKIRMMQLYATMRLRANTYEAEALTSGDLRVIFRELSDGTYEIVELLDVGKHGRLYG